MQSEKVNMHDETLFAALKLIQNLYRRNFISSYMYNNILSEYEDCIDITDFQC